MNFYLNPFHAWGILGFFLTAMALGMHGSAILGTYNTGEDPAVETANVDNFWRDYIGYSIGEYGIHGLGFWLAIYTLIMSDLCILTSGTVVKDWVAFWHWHLPWFRSEQADSMATVIPRPACRRSKRRSRRDYDERTGRATRRSVPHSVPRPIRRLDRNSARSGWAPGACFGRRSSSPASASCSPAASRRCKATS